MERYAVLNEGQTYRNRNGSDYICMKPFACGGAVLERTTDRWTLEAHGITLYEDGTIEWDYSTGGHWLHGETEQSMEKQTPTKARVQEAFDYLETHRAELEEQQKRHPWKDILMLAADAVAKRERAATCSAYRS